MQSKYRNRAQENRWVRADSIYNPIEGKWEKRLTGGTKKQNNGLEFGQPFQSVKSELDGFATELSTGKEKLKSMVSGLKTEFAQSLEEEKREHEQEQADAPKKTMIRRLQDAVEEQREFDQENWGKLYPDGEEDGDDSPEDKRALNIIQVIITIIGLLVVFFN